MFNGILSFLKKENRVNYREHKKNLQKNNIIIRNRVLTEPSKCKKKCNIKSLNMLNSKQFINDKGFIILLLIIFLSMFLQIYSSQRDELRKLSSDNFIILTIEGIGDYYIINETFSPLPTSIKINDNEEITGTIDPLQTLTLTSNTIKLTWNTQMTSCDSMFRGRTNITMIDLTNLDFSLVNNM